MVQTITRFNPYESLSQGIGDYASNRANYNIKQNRLNKGLEALYDPEFEDKPYTQQAADLMKALLPNGPEGAQALQDILPMLKQRQSNKDQNKPPLAGTGPGLAGAGAGVPEKAPEMPWIQKGQSIEKNPKYVKPKKGENGGAPSKNVGLQQEGQQNPYYPNNIGIQGAHTGEPKKSVGNQPERNPTKQEMFEAAKARVDADTTGKTTLKDALSIESEFANIGERNNQTRLNEQREVREVNSNIIKEAKTLSDSIAGKDFFNPTEDAHIADWMLDANAFTDNKAEQNKIVSKKIEAYKDVKTSIKNKASRPSWLNDMSRKLEGSYKDADLAKKELRTMVQPMLDLGLYDEARELVSDNDWGPIETEEIISDLSPETMSYVKNLPKAIQNEKYNGPKKSGMNLLGEATKKALVASNPLSPMHNPEQAKQSIEFTKENLSNILERDPSVNLVLLRDQFEKKGVNWQEFSQALNEYIEEQKNTEEGQRQFQLTGDQRKQLNNNMTQPPLKGLWNRFENLITGKH